MFIDLEPIFSGLQDSIIIDEFVTIPVDWLVNTSIKEIKNVHFNGIIKRIDNLPIVIEGFLTGSMILLDDVDLSDVDYKFNIEVDDELEEEYSELIEEDKFNLLDFSWQLIQVEVPSKIRGNNLRSDLSGDGWKFINEEQINNKNAFDGLDKMLEERSQNNGSSS